MNELLTMSVKEMARRIRAGELSPVEAVEAHISRIEEVNPAINAVISTRYSEARREAQAAEQRQAQSRDGLPPLFGVPCSIKESYAVKGLPWTSGVWARRDTVADFDCVLVERVQKAGAIVLGKTNVPEATMWCESYNYIYGRTKNPYDLRRGAGGSSGGEGAIVAASGTPFGLGADIGGSIRYPAAFNGVAGHKPTGRIVPNTGQWPPGEGPLNAYYCSGPFARRVSDLAYIMPILVGPDGVDPMTLDRPWRGPETVDPAKLKVYFFEDNGQAKTDADTRRAINQAAGVFAGRGVPVESWRPEGMEKSLNIWQAGMAQNPDPMVKILGDGVPIPLLKEFGKFLLRRGKITAPCMGSALIERPGQWLSWLNRKNLALMEDLRRRIEEKLGDNGVLLSPVFPIPAPKHGHPWLHLFGIGYSGVMNIMEFPATILPIFHRSEDGVPVSIQVVSKRFNDHVTLAAAQVLEEAMGGWKPIEKVGSR